MKKKSLILFLLALFLLLSMGSAVSGTDTPTPSSPPKESPHHHEQTRERKEVCKNSDSHEECLLKGTVAAHTDYIYTQDSNSP
ncbi:PREDICTED: phytosulfokines 1 [Tarenaya hassleriana]|uniref:phytosulfokines 1 n=1 Tax=Tarenaya hassleriana TaxID=28532 RepID=UPI00053C0FD9|nr:PREDICTED: phytosulfokines 1 [Tarenaya hassleriana]